MSLRKTIWLAVSVICFAAVLGAQVAPLTVVDEPLPPLEAGVQFYFLLHAAGGVAPYVWSVAAGELP